MKLFKFIPLAIFCSSLVATAQEITVAQPLLPKDQEQPEFNFVPPQKIGNITAKDNDGKSARTAEEVVTEPVQVITLADDGKIVITTKSDQE